MIVVFWSCKPESNENLKNNVKLVIYYTNDEHGWIEGKDGKGGAAEMLNTWKDSGADTECLLLSGGDVWSGPAISTWFQGKPMIEVMNAMGYAAAALGNHEFDAKVDNLQELVNEASFPFLAANIIDKQTGEIPDFVKPYTIVQRKAVNVGIIGLASLTTPYTTFPDYVENFEFTDYEAALNKYVPEMKAKGAQILILIGHICKDEMLALKPVAQELGISFIGGAHCHQTFLDKNDDIVLLQAASYMKKYGRTELEYDFSSEKIKILNAEILDNPKSESKDAEIAQIITEWSARIDSALADTVGYASAEIKASSNEMANMITDSWLWRFPENNVSVTNSGGIRQDIEEGYITLEELVGVLPFNNSLVELELTGKQLLDCVKGYELGGMVTLGDAPRFTNGTLIYQDSVYKVITTDYLYSVSNNNFAKYDTTPYNTSVHYRQPTIDWIKSLNTSKSNPLNNYLNGNARH